MSMLELLGHGAASGLDTLVAKPDNPGLVRKRFAAGTTLVEPGRGIKRTLFLTSGWAVCAKDLPNGTRTVIDFALAGDLVSAELADLTQETVEARTELTAVEFIAAPRSQDGRACPNPAQLVSVGLMARYARMAERLSGMARRDAPGRIAHLLLELSFRSAPTPKAGINSFACPLTQADIGDALGLSTVHVNRVLRDMRLEGLLSFRNGLVEFLDRHRLIEIADFDARYLEIAVD
jgi:CRP-like cAMP-binding protein